ncbi:CZB domain-containing protein [Profundibacter sp.]
MSNEKLINQINNAIGAHGSWKIKLRTAVKKGKSVHSVEDVRCDDKCAFGMWIHGTDIDGPTRSSVPFNVIKRLHAEFHVCAADVLKMATTGNTNEATDLLDGDFSAKSEKLVRGLRKWRGEAAAD